MLLAMQQEAQSWKQAFELETERSALFYAQICHLQGQISAAQIRIAHVTAENQRLNLLMGHLVFPPL